MSVEQANPMHDAFGTSSEDEEGGEEDGGQQQQLANYRFSLIFRFYFILNYYIKFCMK
jgi:hypothetical protein